MAAAKELYLDEGHGALEVLQHVVVEEHGHVGILDWQDFLFGHEQ